MRLRTKAFYKTSRSAGETLMNLEPNLSKKLERLREIAHELGKAAIAFSGGVDSTLLLKVFHGELGDNAIAVTARSLSIPKREISDTEDFCESEGIIHVVVDTTEFSIPGFADNPPNRCYLCKREILTCLINAARDRGFDALVEGSNADDDDGDRPGSKAVAELHVRSPLREAYLTKDEIRTLARHFGLSVWDKPSLACLNTRFAFGDRITPEKLSMVDTAESALIALGFPQVRARFRAGEARIELPQADIIRAIDNPMREKIVDACKQAGFTRVSIDLEGYKE